jgi:hypothetical protein
MMVLTLSSQPPEFFEAMSLPKAAPFRRKNTAAKLPG